MHKGARLAQDKQGLWGVVPEPGSGGYQTRSSMLASSHIIIIVTIIIKHHGHDMYTLGSCKHAGKHTHACMVTAAEVYTPSYSTATTAHCMPHLEKYARIK